ADLAGRDVDVVGAGQVAGVGRAQEAEAVRQDLQHALADDVAGAGQHPEQLEGDVLLARARHALGDAEFLGHLHQLVRRLALQVGEADRRQLRAVRVRRLGVLVLVVVVHRAAVLRLGVAAVAAVVAVVAAPAAATAAAALALVALPALALAALAGLLGTGVLATLGGGLLRLVALGIGRGALVGIAGVVVGFQHGGSSPGVAAGRRGVLRRRRG